MCKPDIRANRHKENAKNCVEDTGSFTSENTNKGLGASVPKKPRPVRQARDQTKSTGDQTEYGNKDFVHLPKVRIICQFDVLIPTARMAKINR